MISSFFITGDQTPNGITKWVTPAGTLSTVHSGNAVITSVKAVSDRGRPVTYVVSSGTLPPGVTLDANTGRIMGLTQVNSNTQTYSFTITALG